MLNVIIIAGALASVGVTSSRFAAVDSRESLVVASQQSLVDSRQSTVGSSPGGASTIYHSPFTIQESSTIYHLPFSSRQSSVGSGQEKISSLYSTISTLYSPLSTLKKDSTLAEVTISAPKYPEKLARSGKVVSVISAEMIQANQGKSLGELLQQSVGVAVVGARSAPGTNQEIYVRGANTGHVLLLMDGFPLNDPSHISSVMDWNLISLANIEDRKSVV